MKLIFFALLVTLFSGCVGIGTVVSTEYERKATDISTEKGVILNTKNNQYTKKDILSIWGEPKQINSKDNKEYWTYNRELKWKGITILILIPIPIYFPVGMKETTLIFENEIMIGSIHEGSRSPMAVCGPLMPMMHGAKGTCSVIYDFKF